MDKKERKEKIQDIKDTIITIMHDWVKDNDVRNSSTWQTLCNISVIYKNLGD